jgi:hypothetical protein
MRTGVADNRPCTVSRIYHEPGAGAHGPPRQHHLGVRSYGVGFARCRHRCRSGCRPKLPPQPVVLISGHRLSFRPLFAATDIYGETLKFFLKLRVNPTIFSVNCRQTHDHRDLGVIGRPGNPCGLCPPCLMLLEGRLVVRPTARTRYEERQCDLITSTADDRRMPVRSRHVPRCGDRPRHCEPERADD